MVVGAYALVVLGLAAFVTGTVLLVVDDEISLYAMLCLEVGGVATLLVGLKKVRDLRRP